MSGIRRTLRVERYSDIIISGLSAGSHSTRMVHGSL